MKMEKFKKKVAIVGTRYLPDYSKYGIKAPLRRNTQIIKEASLVIAFSNADSRGTLHAISEAKKMKKTVKVVKI